MASCTKTITVSQPPVSPSVVVEGYIENNKPPYVLLTTSTSYFGGIPLNDLSAYFIHGATMKISDGKDTVALTEFCLGGLPDSIERQVAQQFGYAIPDTEKVLPNICIYTVPNVLNYYLGDTAGVFQGHVTHTYNLLINVNGKTLTSTTYIPGLVPGHLSFLPRHLNAKDTLGTIEITFTDPDTPGNSYIYYTQRNSEPFYTPFGNIFFDELFNGQHVTFPLTRGMNANENPTSDSVGYFKYGDSVQVKWATMDIHSYNFWNTLESDLGSTPISTPTQIVSNINGGLGVWCGFGAVYPTYVIPK